MLIFRRSRSQIFFKISALKTFVIFTGKLLCWPLQAFFYRTPIVTASRFSRQQILFSGESGIYCWPSRRFLLQTPSKTRSKPKKQPLQLFYKKDVLRNFANFTRKHLCWSFFLIGLLLFTGGLQLYQKETQTKMFSWRICKIFKNT